VAVAILLCLPAAASAHHSELRSADLFGEVGLAADVQPAAGAPLYPDLRTLPPRDLRFDVTSTDNGSNRTVLRFTNTVWNAGEGPLLVNGDVPPGTTTTPALQVVNNDDGTSASYTIGNYTIHSQHQHFHYDGWGRYELWTKTAYDNWIAAGRPSNVDPDMIGAKTTSCVLDEEFIASLPTTPYPKVYSGGGCDPTTTHQIKTGLAVGWGDTYDYDRYDQWIDMGTKIPDGTYVLRSVADPDNKVYESAGKADPAREGQLANEAATTFTVSGGQILDTDRPSGTVTVNDVATRTTSTNVTVRMIGRDDVSGVDQVRISNDGVTWNTRTYGGSGSSPMSVAWDLADTRYGGSTQTGTRTVYVQFHDRSGKWSPTITDTIEYGSGTPGGGGSNSIYRAEVMTDGPVGYWRLAEASGSTAFDETGALPGVYDGPVGRAVTGLLSSDLDRAAGFTTGTSVDVPESSRLQLGSRFSLEAWIRPNSIPSPGGWASIVTRPESYSLQFNGPLLEFTVIQNGSRRRLQAPAGTVVAGQTYHVVGTYDGAETRLYVNGAQVAGGTLTGAPSAGQSGLHIGSWESYTEFFNGTIDEVAIYDSLLTGLAAKKHWDAGISAAVGVSTPTGLAATPASTSQIDLGWTDTSSNETGFVVQRSTSSSFTSPTEVTLPQNATTHSATGLAAGTTYWFRVKAITATDSSAWSNVVSAATQSAPTPPPATPTGLSATAASSTRVDARWTDASSDETGFELQRSTSSSFTTPSTFTIAANGTSYADTGVAGSTTYWYRVRSVRGTTPSAWSAATSVTTPAATTPAYASAVAADNPVSHWRLGEASGTTAADVKGVNNGTYRQGVLLGGVSLLSRDTGNTSIGVDGTNDWVQVPDSASLDLRSGFSVEAWIRPDAIPSSGGWASVVTKAESYSIQFNGPRLEFTVMRGGNRFRLQAASGAVVAGRTYHVVGTYDGATQRLYLNGTQVASRAQTGLADAGTWPLAIGSWTGFGEFFRGRIDEAAVYGSVLSAARVSAHYTAGGAPATAAAASAKLRRAKAPATRQTKALGPGQRLTFRLKGPGTAARKRACAAAAASARSKTAKQRRAAARRACRSLRKRR
jgi:hypothetical protein